MRSRKLPARANLADLIAAVMWGPKSVKMILEMTAIGSDDTAANFLSELHSVGAVRVIGKHKPYEGAPGVWSNLWAWQTSPHALPDTPHIRWVDDPPRQLKIANEVTPSQSVTP